MFKRSMINRFAFNSIFALACLIGASAAPAYALDQNPRHVDTLRQQQLVAGTAYGFDAPRVPAQFRQKSFQNQYNARSAQRYDSAALEISAKKAKSIALNYVKGSEFLDIKLIDGNTYRVRVMQNGRRIDVYINANSGQIS